MCINVSHTRMAKTLHILRCKQSHVFVSMSIVRKPLRVHSSRTCKDMQSDMFTAVSSPNLPQPCSHSTEKSSANIILKSSSEHIAHVISGFVIQRSAVPIPFDLGRLLSLLSLLSL